MSVICKKLILILWGLDKQFIPHFCVHSTPYDCKDLVLNIVITEITKSLIRCRHVGLSGLAEPRALQKHEKPAPVFPQGCLSVQDSSIVYLEWDHFLARHIQPMLTERWATVYSADRYLSLSYSSVKQTRPPDRSLADHPMWTCHADILCHIVSCVILFITWCPSF